MAERNNAKCSICGKDYYKCVSCKDAMALSPWKAFCDTAEHYKVHQLIRAYNSNVYTKDEAKDKLKNIDLSDVDTFKPNIKQIVKDILKEDKIVVEAVETESAIIKETPVYKSVINAVRENSFNKKNYKSS